MNNLMLNKENVRSTVLTTDFPSQLHPADESIRNRLSIFLKVYFSKTNMYIQLTNYNSPPYILIIPIPTLAGFHNLTQHGNGKNTHQRCSSPHKTRIQFQYPIRILFRSRNGSSSNRTTPSPLRNLLSSFRFRYRYGQRPISQR